MQNEKCMQVHEIKPIHKQKKRRRIGQGGKKGTYSGRGIKGQKARTGYRMQPRIRELLKRYPKLRGYRRKDSGKEVVPVNVELLEKHFNPGDTVNPQLLAEKRIVRTIEGRIPAVKILGKGEITKALTIEGCAVSQAAREKIEKAGGTIP
jgi:large subunit ribosomal protein L15